MEENDSNTSQNPELSSRVFINKKPYFAKLSNETLSWCKCETSATKKDHFHHCHVLKLKRVLAIVPNVKQETGVHPNDIELNTISPVNHYRSFHLHIVIKKGNHKWQHRKVLFECPSVDVGSKWFSRIQDILTDFKRPKKLLIFVNPYGGKKQAPKIFRNKVEPLFHLAKIDMEVVETTRADHAKDFITSEPDLTEYDGIISVGGDGMFSEILNGILMRKNKHASSSTEFNPEKPEIKLGIIPAGSTDCVCYCTTGCIDAVTSALQIITGEDQPLDISSIHSGSELLRYSVSFAGYGFFGDVMKDSEKLRWAGVKRYDISGAKIFLANRFYEGELSYLISSDAQGHPQDKNKCRTGCSVCFPPQNPSFGKLVPEETSGWHSITGRFISVMGATNCCANKKSPEGISPSAHLADGCIDLVVVRHTSRVRYLHHMIRLAGRADHMDFDFVEVHRVKEFSFRPVSSAVSEDDESETGASSSRQECGGELTRRTQRTQRRGKERSQSRHSVWNVDGEIIDEPAIHVRVHRQLVTLFAYGIEECEKMATCSVCRTS
ncbi:ceramide kinase-like [Dendronephthya gigantea]|uniref:ceramide kinase-like n=1 Tax=Dendronephthya gigantea TaxID=151771 RepID=UPI00106CAD51|nr:ceramide kinase-like [Dendronephthya gigantea]